ncbi:DUF1834 family protein [Aeromonas piscicola]|uniref:DUF1834 family protein n=1 Tax=Aeromonas piscicola TaxID=600645 RepID=UPI0005B415D2|nr:phage protein Gp37 [Aeromonas piscicola]
MIADVEAALLARISTSLGRTVREVASHPGHWDDEAVRQVTRTPPAVYIAWLGLMPGRFDGEVVNRWAAFVAAPVANAQRTDQLGAYQITERLIATLHGRSLSPGGLFSLQEVRNLWSETQSGTGVAIYGLYFNSPGLIDELTDEEEALPDFERHYQTWSADNVGAPEMAAHITLDTPKE